MASREPGQRTCFCSDRARPKPGIAAAKASPPPLPACQVPATHPIAVNRDAAVRASDRGITGSKPAAVDGIPDFTFVEPPTQHSRRPKRTPLLSYYVLVGQLPSYLQRLMRSPSGLYVVAAACGLAVIMVVAVGLTLIGPSRSVNYDKASQQDPNSAETYYSRGLAHASKGAWESAIADYTEAIRLKPTFAEALCGRGYAYHRKGLAEKAIASLASSLGSKTAISTTYGDVHLDAAMADFNEAIRFNPKYCAGVC